VCWQILTLGKDYLICECEYSDDFEEPPPEEPEEGAEVRCHTDCPCDLYLWHICVLFFHPQMVVSVVVMCVIVFAG